MTALCFVDTNVLLYQKDQLSPEKQTRATEWMAWLWREGAGRLSYQVLVEYDANVRRLDPDARLDEIRTDVANLFEWNPLSVDRRVIEGAWQVQDRIGLSWWDSLIVAAADLSGCDYLLSEDLQDGQLIGRVRVVDPFRHAPADLPR